MKPDEMRAKRESLACPICGGGSDSWGIYGSVGSRFIANDASQMTKFFQIAPQLRARRCLDCGNLQLFAARG